MRGTEATFDVPIQSVNTSFAAHFTTSVSTELLNDEFKFSQMTYIKYLQMNKRRCT